MLPRRQENLRWKKVRKLNEAVIYLRNKRNGNLFVHTEENIIAAAPIFAIIDENGDEDVNIED